MMNMKKLSILLLFALLLSLIGCTTANEKTAAESYLADHTDEEILDWFENAFLFYQDFEDPQEISTEHLYKFTLFHSKDSWFNENERLFYIPLADIYEILDTYLPSYNFETDQFEGYIYDDQIVTTATGIDMGNTALDLVKAEIIDDENIKVTLLVHSIDGENLPTDNIYITAKIINGEAKFTSRKSERN